MPNPIEYASYIIDLTNAMMGHQQGLSHEQFYRINLINHRAVTFITTYMQKENISAFALLEYLSEDAQQPLRSIRGNCKKMLAGEFGNFDDDYVEAIEEIRACAHEMVYDIQQSCRDLRQFMATIGMDD
jgi:hypothetical protein